MLKTWRKSLDSKKSELRVYTKEMKQWDKVAGDLDQRKEVLQESRELIQKASLITQNHLAEHLSGIVTKALRSVFYEKDVEFKAEFVERRNTTECDMYIMENGFRFSLLNSRGFGMADIASFALRVAYIMLDSVDDVLCIDEPFRNLSEDKHELASEMIRELANELGFQFIISTHVDKLKEYADKSFYIIQTEGVSNAT